MLAGPGTLTTLLSLRAEFALENVIISIILNVIVIYVVLKTSSKLQNILGKNGIGIIQKVFGVILLAIAVKLFAANIQELLIDFSQNMKYFRYVLIAIALTLFAFNATILDPDNLMEGDSQIAVIGILASAGVIVLIVILIQSERIKKKAK